MSKPNTLSEGLISYWSFDSNTNDNHGNNNGIVSGATFQSGQGIIGDTYYFDGTDDYINVPKDYFELSDGAHLTINIWIKTTSPTSGNPISAWALTSDPQNESGFGLYFNNKWYMGTGTQWYSINAEILDDDSWHMYTLIYDGIMTAYRDCEQISYSNSFVAKYIINEYLTIGDDNRGLTGREFLGYIDEIGIWDRALIKKDLNVLYNNSQGLKYNNFRYGNI